MALFGRARGGAGDSADSQVRRPRHSSGWAALAGYMQVQESLRVLDFGPTSAGNINFITALGHSIYMANLVEDAARPEYTLLAEDGSPGYDVERFLAQNLDFAGRTFDIVMLWDTLDYLPAPLLQPVVDRLHAVMVPGGRLLAFFHGKAAGEEARFHRYHLTATDVLDLQYGGDYPVLQTPTNRQVETLFADYGASKFFLAKDALREVLVTR